MSTTVKPKKNTYTQNPNKTNDYTGGIAVPTYGGFKMPTTTPSGSTFSNVAQPVTNSSGGTSLPKVTSLDQLTPGATVYGNTSGARYSDSEIPGLGVVGAVTGAHAGMIVPQKEEKKRSGGGGSTLPNLPAELANQIADAYARSQGTGPDAWQNRYQAEIDGMRGQRYGDYESQYIPQINGLVDRLLNRDSFSYNWSDDPLYRQYAARYQQAARQGMQDTMGQAAAMTGGYGNSYATAAANQAYANQMAGLNDRAMELYQLAAENYDRDTNNLRSNLQQLEQREAANRGNYDTDRAVFYDRQDADLNNLLNQQAMDYQVWADEVARDQAERQLAWQQYAYWNDLYHNKYNYKG